MPPGPLLEGGRITGTTTDRLLIDPVWRSDAGDYDVGMENECGATASEAPALSVGPARGDLNCDGWIDFGDINPFVLALSNGAAYYQQ